MLPINRTNEGNIQCNYDHLKFLCILVILEEFRVLAENLRPHTSHAMKIEVAPWVQGYVVDMDDLYTELELEKIHNKPTGEEKILLKNYTELFAEEETKTLDTDSAKMLKKDEADLANSDGGNAC